jgi:hypothetical protein
MLTYLCSACRRLKRRQAQHTQDLQQEAQLKAMRSQVGTLQPAHCRRPALAQLRLTTRVNMMRQYLHPCLLRIALPAARPSGGRAAGAMELCLHRPRPAKAPAVPAQNWWQPACSVGAPAGWTRDATQDLRLLCSCRRWRLSGTTWPCASARSLPPAGQSLRTSPNSPPRWSRIRCPSQPAPCKLPAPWRAHARSRTACREAVHTACRCA